MLNLKNLFALVAVASLASCDDSRSNLLCYLCAVAVVEPLLSKSLELLSAALSALNLGEETCKTLTHLVVSKLHTKTELAEVLEQ